ncbi:putative fungal specific transcription factor [Lyophyllum shimeji]|uniref:Fungal specific transcription factor n=1 Tax=Lyophyllum shimeji TaxID=47721 RepID=A0A9P3PXB2_LYOSH|nr:putative fungal specific transcription factor [Lyophyllum shimeji]
MPPAGRDGKEKDGAPKVRRKPGRVPTSCAECRRLKLRCDKNVPCEKCVSRGCGSICPDGSLTPGKGNRLVLANTEELHDRIETLCTRIRELENALRSLQESVSDEPHPLLQKDVLQPVTPRTLRPPRAPTPAVDPSPPTTVPPPPEEPPDHTQSQAPQADDESFADAFGTLSIGVRSECSFFGTTARPEYLIQASTHQPSQANPLPPRLSKRLIELSELQACDAALGREIFSLLPTLSEAIHLCEIYQEHGKFMYTPVPRRELFDEILTAVYRVDSFEALTLHHSLALLLIVFAIAALFDTDREPYSTGAQEFYLLSRATLRFNPRTTRTSIQALIHIAQYLDFSDWNSTESNAAWTYVGQAVRLGHSAGLHLNGTRWNLSDPNVQRRSRLFWQLFHLDTWTSFYFGRPPTMTTSYIDSPIPKDPTELSNGDREAPGSFHIWNWQYTVLLRSIIDTAFGSKQPDYHAVLDMDRRIRDFPVPLIWRPVCDPGQSTPLALHIQRWIILSTKEITLLNLHRAYFARALQEMPTDLARHRYIPSVMAIYRSAWRLIQGLQLAWKIAPHPIARTGLPWSQALSAAIVMCLLVTRVPASILAGPAFAELHVLLELFQDAAPAAPSAAHLLDTIHNLHKKAYDVIEHVAPPDAASPPPSDTELDRWGGKTHLLAEVGAPDAATSGTSEAMTLTVGPDNHFSAANVNHMHPTLAQDMRSFDVGAPAFNIVDNLFDYPASTTPPVVPQQPPIPDLSAADASFFSTSAFHTYHPQPPTASFEQAAPILDSTWQSFVEQLGF